MKIMILTFLILGGVSVTLHAQTPEESDVVKQIKEGIKMFCREQWGTDYRMQKYCIEKQHEGIQKRNSLHNSASNINEEVFREIDSKCIAQWFKDKKEGEYIIVDWRMVAYCDNKQWEAWKALQ